MTSKIKLITFYSESHKEVYNFFLNSFTEHLLPKYELKTKLIQQISKTGDFFSEGFGLTMVKKLDWILENIDENSNEVMVFSDCDVQFFGDLIFDLKENDILFQYDGTFFDNSWYPDGATGITKHPNCCAGFFICKQNKKIKKFFLDIKSVLLKNMNETLHDQIVMNKLLSTGYDIKFDILDPVLYWTVGFLTNACVWSNQEIIVPKSIIMHHANFTIGIKNKIRLLNTVKQLKI